MHFHDCQRDDRESSSEDSVAHRVPDVDSIHTIPSENSESDAISGSGEHQGIQMIQLAVFKNVQLLTIMAHQGIQMIRIYQLAVFQAILVKIPVLMKMIPLISTMEIQIQFFVLLKNIPRKKFLFWFYLYL